MIGSDSATVTEVTLVESSGSGQVNGSVEPLGGGVFFVHFDRIPSVEFVVLIKGQSSSTTSKSSSSVPFQRQSPTSVRASSVTVTAVRKNISTYDLPFKVEGNYNSKTVTNHCPFPLFLG